jgi:hypothetical protein
VVVAHQSNDATIPRRASQIGMAKHVASTVDARPFAVPHAEHAIEFAFAAQLSLLRTPQRGGGEVFIQAGLELDVGSHKLSCRAHELLVETAERRTTVPGDITGSVQAGAPITLFLHQAGTNQRLITCDEYVRLAQVVFVVEADRSERHGWPCCRGAQGAGSHSYRLVLRVAKR